jgi:hypothetical protein
MAKSHPRIQVTVSQENIKPLIEWANERELKPSQAINKIIQIFFMNQDKFYKTSQSNSEETYQHLLEDIKKLSNKMDFIRAVFIGTVLDLIESSVLVKEAAWNSEESIRVAEETRENYESVIEKYESLLEET